MSNKALATTNILVIMTRFWDILAANYSKFYLTDPQFFWFRPFVPIQSNFN